MKTYTGGCHCGAVQFKADADIEAAMACTCSHCAQKGFLLAFIPATQFHLTAGEDNLTEYRFNKKHIAHLFCKTCGVQSFGRGTDKEGNATIALNVRCLNDFDIDTLTINKVNGKDF